MGDHVVQRQRLRAQRVPNPRQSDGQPRECVIKIESHADVVVARRKGRSMAMEIGFDPRDLTRITAAISELAGNIIAYAKRGEIILTRMDQESRQGIAVVGRDDGPGILDVSQAMRDGFSTTGRLGLGLPGVRRLMDEFEILSEPGRGTAVTVKKWMS